MKVKKWVATLKNVLFFNSLKIRIYFELQHFTKQQNLISEVLRLGYE